jgi:hypothetical protein
LPPDGHLERYRNGLFEFPLDRGAPDAGFPAVGSGSGKVIRESVVVVISGIVNVVEVDEILRPPGNFASLDRFVPDESLFRLL